MPLDGRPVDDDVLRRLAAPFASRSVDVASSRDQRDGERDPPEVEDERTRARIDVPGTAALVTVEARRDLHDEPRGGASERIPRTSTGSAGVTRSVTSTVVLAERGRRRRHRRAIGVALLPRARLVVEPERRAVALEPEPELAEMLAVVDVRPEQTLDLASRADGGEQRAVAEDRGGAERVPPPGFVECGRDVGLGRHERNRTETTGDVETEPSLARATATNETC